MDKPPFGEEEINELCDLYADTYYDVAISDVIIFLEKLGYSKVSNIMIQMRKEFLNKRCPERHTKRRSNYLNSTLQSKLSERLDALKPINEIQ